MRRSGQIACKNRKIIRPWGNIDYKTIDTKKKFNGFVIKSAKCISLAAIRIYVGGSRDFFTRSIAKTVP